jgi:apolipoprotein N-acyltransferase
VKRNPAPLNVAAIVALLLASMILITAAFAPAGIFFLAWIGLAPWLIVVHRAPTAANAFWWSWLGGICIFTANLWWIGAVNVPGLFALMAYCGIYWALLGWLIRAARVLEKPAAAACLAVAAFWTAGEFIRAHLFTGFPWLLIGHTQTPFLPICQIADTLGAYGVSFWVAMVNALAAMILIGRGMRSLASAFLMTALVTAAAIGYGLWRMGQSTTTAGPNVLVVQSNYPQSNAGEKSAPDDELLRFHVDQTLQGIKDAAPAHMDLAVWSETMMPPLNRASLIELTQAWPCELGQDIQQALSELSILAAREQMGILTGGRYCDGWAMTQVDDKMLPQPADSRNSAYLFQPDGTFSDLPGGRYDKIHLVPFGEFIPFHYSIPILYRLFLALGPKYYADYELHDGSDNGLTVFRLQTRGSAGLTAGDSPGPAVWRFVTPICFEDIDARLCARMFRPQADGRKRADFIVNVTNDGWFAPTESAQHFQAATFRCIENRVPMARSVNTGISGFIDSDGRSSRRLAAGTSGASWSRIMPDSRLTVYTQWGDWFAWCCVIYTAGAAASVLVRRAAGKGA